MKNKLIFCVLTHYDQHYLWPNSNKRLDEKWEQFFKKKNMSFLWENRILWIS